MKKKYVKPTTTIIGVDMDKALLLGISGETTPEQTESKEFNFGMDGIAPDSEDMGQLSESWDAWD